MKLYTELFMYHAILDNEHHLKVHGTIDEETVEPYIESMKEWCNGTIGLTNYQYEFVDNNSDEYLDVFKFKTEQCLFYGGHNESRIKSTTIQIIG